MMTAINFQEKFPRKDASKCNNLTLNEDLADVVIEVYPPETSIDCGDDPQKQQQDCTPPAARLSAHAAILAAKNNYFKTLFTNGISETLGPTQTLCTVDATDGQNLVVQSPKKIISIKGYSVKAVKYFIAFLYDDAKNCILQRGGTENAETEHLVMAFHLLKMADEYESFSMFDAISYEMMSYYLNGPGETSHYCVLALLNIAYEFPGEISQVLREGGWWYFDQNYLQVLRTKTLTEKVKKKLLKKELLADLFLKVLPNLIK
ncbi:hypothetical protein DFS34DRAFT_656997 [Phlyctochytrium arcticum]|nr:hypothetical protein DFS34DRAFT_656997 [Phlyctochytrium arcticum]